MCKTGGSWAGPKSHRRGFGFCIAKVRSAPYHHVVKRPSIIRRGSSTFAAAFLVAVGVALWALPAHAQSRATYRLTFESTWSAATHPTDFPSNPHFSGLIGGTHNANVSFWNEGQVASDGIESMAETGSKTLLQSEVNTAIGAGTAEFVVSGGGIGVSPGSVSVTFDVTTSYPLATVVSMVAPSPDWFVGVSGLNLMEEGDWLQRVQIPLTVYDAGSDNGTSYRSPNDDTNPPENIAALTTSPFDMSNIVGTFTFDLLSVVGLESVPGLSDRYDLTQPFPNPASGTATLRLTVRETQVVHGLLYDVAGRLVRHVRVGRVNAGEETAISIDSSGLARQLYVLRLTGQTFSAARPILFVR